MLSNLLKIDKAPISQSLDSVFFSGRTPSITISVPELPHVLNSSIVSNPSNLYSGFSTQYFQKNLIPIIVIAILIFILLTIYLVNLLQKKEKKEKKKRNKKNSQTSTYRSDTRLSSRNSDTKTS